MPHPLHVVGPASPSAVERVAAAPIVLDPAMRQLYELASRIARGSISVLIIGETGTGKEVLAEFLHQASARAAGPFLRVNCGALAESLVDSELFGHERGAFTGALRDRRGLLESAHGGTIVLDEIGEMPLAMQVKLLRVVEAGALIRVGSSAPQAIDVRFIAATNRDLQNDVASGTFRRDLYFRLAGAVLAIPPLRERPDELVAMATAFATAAARRIGLRSMRLDAGALAALRAHSWPGNVRELRNVIERGVLVADGDTITVDDLALGAAHRTAVPRTASLTEELAAFERDRILEALERTNGVQIRAAQLLGIPLRTLVKRIEAYGIPRPRKKS